MNVRRPARVRDRLDRSEIIFAGRTRQKAAEALKIRVPALRVLLGEIDAVPVALPDFDEDVSHRLSACGEDAAGKVGHFAHGGRDVVVDDEEIVIGVKRQLGGIKRSLRDARCAGQFVGIRPANKKSGGAECQTAADQVASE